MYIPLPKLTPDGYRVIMLYISDDAKYTQLPPFNHFLKATLMSIDIMGKYDYPKGVIVVHDGKNISMEFVANAATEIHKLVLLAAVSKRTIFETSKGSHTPYIRSHKVTYFNNFPIKTLFQKSIPVRYRNLYFFNMNSATQIFLSIGKNFIKKDLANRV